MEHTTYKILNAISFSYKISIFIFFLFIFGYSESSLMCRLISSWGKLGLLSSCGAQASHCNGFSCCRAWALRHIGFSGRGTWAQQLWFPGSRAQAQQLWHKGFVAASHVGSSWIRRDIKTMSLACQEDSLPLSHQGSSSILILNVTRKSFKPKIQAYNYS